MSTPVTVENPSHPGPVEPTETLRFSSRDGTGLYGEWFPAPSPRAACLIMHGYAEHCGRYREVAHVLTQAGISALSYDMRGHGRADGQRGHTSGVRRYLDDMDAALAELFRRAGDVPFFLLGHSNGGLIALRALADPIRCPRTVTCAVVSSPFLGLKVDVNPVKSLVGKAAGRYLPALSMPNELVIEHLTTDTGKQAERRVDTLCHDVASARWYTSALRAHEYVADNAHRIEVPTLWLVAGDDHIADPAASRLVRARLRAPATYHELTGLQHEVFNERERGRVFGLLTDFLDATFS